MFFSSDQNRQLMELSQSEFETGSGQALAMIYPATHRSAFREFTPFVSEFWNILVFQLW